jgi:hypothetical protein
MRSPLAYRFWALATNGGSNIMARKEVIPGELMNPEMLVKICCIAGTPAGAASWLPL